VTEPSDRARTVDPALANGLLPYKNADTTSADIENNSIGLAWASTDARVRADFRQTNSTTAAPAAAAMTEVTSPRRTQAWRCDNRRTPRPRPPMHWSGCRGSIQRTAGRAKKAQPAGRREWPAMTPITRTRRNSQSGRWRAWIKSRMEWKQTIVRRQLGHGAKNR